MPDIEPATLAAASDLGRTVLAQRGDIAAASVFGNTSKHLIMQAQDKTGQTFCLKVALAPHAASGHAKTETALEIAALRRIGDRAYWAPHLIAASEVEGWLLRTWVGRDTANKISRSDWNKDRLDQLWKIFAEAFACFHEDATPHLMRDIKPSNLCYDTKGFYLFDFNTVKPLDAIRNARVKSRFGNNSNRYAAPETLSGDFSGIDHRSDYFGFASVFHRFATGLAESVWSNSEAQEQEARRRYAAEYAALIPAYRSALGQLGYTRTQSEFLISCLHPEASERPENFLRP